MSSGVATEMRYVDSHADVSCSAMALSNSKPRGCYSACKPIFSMTLCQRRASSSTNAGLRISASDPGRAKTFGGARRHDRCE